MTALGTVPAAANIASRPAGSGLSRDPAARREGRNGTEQAIHAEGGRAGKVGADRIADREHAPERRHLAAAQRGGLGEGRLINQRMRLAAIERLAAERDISVGQRPGAVDQGIAALDDDVGIGADHEQRTLAHERQHLAVALGCLDGVVEQPEHTT